jgi:hypothetical protein
MGKRITVFVVSLVAVMLLAAPVAMAAISVTSMDPTSADRGSSVSCTVYGTFWHPISPIVFMPRFQLVNGATTIDGTSISILDATGEKAYVTFNLPPAAPTGWYTLNASQRHGIVPFLFTDEASLSSAFYVQQRPIITSTNPASAVAGSGDLTLTVYGDYFFSTTFPTPRRSVVRFNGTAVPTTFNSATVLTAVVPAAALTTPGVAEVSVFNPGLVLLSIPATLSDAFAYTITAPTPTITALEPSSAVVGGLAFDLGVTGTNFVTGATGAVVRWNGIDLVTTRDSATHLTAAVPASAIAAAGSATITVRNGTALAAPISNPLTLTVGNAPALTSLSPTQVWAGYVKNDVVLTVNGSNFLSGARIVLSGGDKTGTTFVNATQLTVPLVAADISTPATLTVSVKNPPFPPGVSSAGALLLPVLAETTDPVVTISGAGSAWHNSAVPLTFSASDSQSDVQKVEYQSPPTVAVWTPGTSYTVPVTTQGAIAVSVQALDWCNRVGTASATVNIDTTKPDTDALNAVSVKKGKNAKLKFRISEPVGLSPSANVVIKIKSVKGGNTAMRITIPDAPVNSNQTYSFKCTLKKGAYKWYIYATDLAGNTQANVDKASFTVK